MAKKARHKVQQRKPNNTLWLVGAIALVFLGLSAVWVTSQNTTQPGSYPPEVSVEEAVARRDTGAFILDVREPDEWNQFHVPGSALIPLGELVARMDELPKDKEIVVVCRSGNRSAKGRDILLSAGFTQVTSMAGGLTQWKSSGYPTISGP